MSGAPSLGWASASGGAWNLGGLVVGRATSLLSTAVLARILVPDDFGLMTLGLLVIGYAEAINDFGLGEAVVVDAGRRPRAADVAFVLSVGVGLAFAIAVFVSAPLLADALGDPRLTQVLRALATVLVIVNLGQIQKAELSRRFLFRRRVAGEVTLGVVKAVTSIAFALAGFGVWALVWGQLAGTTARVITDWLLCPWRPRPTFDRSTARSLASFGGRMSLAVTLGTVAHNVDYLAVGRRLGAASLGFYYLAFRLPEFLIVQTTQAVTAVLVPAYVSAATDQHRLRRGLHDATRVVAAVATPLGLLLCVHARDVIRVAFGSAWLAAAPVLQMVALASVATAVTFPAGAALKAMSRPGVLTAVAAARLVLAAPLLWYAAGRHIEAVAQTHLAITVPLAIVQLAIVGSLLGAPALPFRAIAPVLLAAGAMALVAILLPLAEESVLAARSVLAVAGGLAAYVAVLVVLTGRWWQRMFAGLRAPTVAGGEGAP